MGRNLAAALIGLAADTGRAVNILTNHVGDVERRMALDLLKRRHVGRWSAVALALHDAGTVELDPTDLAAARNLRAEYLRGAA